MFTIAMLKPAQAPQAEQSTHVEKSLVILVHNTTKPVVTPTLTRLFAQISSIWNFAKMQIALE